MMKIFGLIVLAVDLLVIVLILLIDISHLWFINFNIPTMTAFVLGIAFCMCVFGIISIIRDIKKSNND